ncbi:MAG: methionine--tRNA ligase [Phycisphaerae bacterium]|nr:methionine--tRNA ligase [Phycisphaerae bacterium]
MAQRRFLITSALPYSNGRLHVGHITGAYLPADTYVRYLRSRGEDVRFICGSDDNGVASLISARKEGKSVEELTAFYNARQAADFKGLSIEFDIYGGTHQPSCVELHTQISQSFFKTAYDKGYFSKKTTEQLYDEQAAQFLPDRYVKGACYHKKVDGTPCGYTEAYGDQCEQCGNSIDAMLLIDPISTITNTRPVPRKTVHWYMQLPKFEQPLREWLESKREPSDGSPPWRETVLNFALGQIKQGLPERAMTRDLHWGVPVPLDDPDAKGKALYVWFDAPIGYVSFTAKWCQENEGDWRGYERWWKDTACKIVHFIGEDNTVFHALTWPAIMMAEGSFQLPWQVVANSFLNIKFPGQEEQKISKSRGTAIWIEEYLKIFEPDPLRYYLTSIAPERQRTAFDVDAFIEANNAILSNTLGNFVNRTLTFAQKYFDNRVPEATQRGPREEQALKEMRESAAATTTYLESLRFKDAMEAVIQLARQGNGYFSEREPWKQRKDNMVGCGTTINTCIQMVKALAVLMAPFMPSSAAKVAAQLNIDSSLRWDDATVELPAGHVLGEPAILFAKLDPVQLFGESA